MMQEEKLQRFVQVLGFASVLIGLSGYYLKMQRKSYKKRPVVTKKLKEFQQYLHPNSQPQIIWVSLCGTVFDVTNVPFFQQNEMGVYSHWVGHDITHHLLSMAIYTSIKEEEEEEEANFDVLVSIDSIKEPQRAQVIEEWYGRFSDRYQVIGQLEDLFNTPEWTLYRQDKLSSSSGTQAKCPLGFGSSKTSHKYQVKSVADRTEFVWFLGQKYDVSSSKAFGPNGLFHLYIGQDITMFLATNSTDPDGTTLEPSSNPRAFTYEEQKRLNHFREVFAREFPVITQKISDASPPVSSLHELLDNGADSELFLEELRKELAKNNKTIDALCPRTGLSLLHKAVENNRLDLVKALVEEAKADTNAMASLYDDDTPLVLAKRFRFQKIIEYLSDLI